MRILLISICIFLSFKASAIKAVSVETHDTYLKSLGLNNTQIAKLKEIENQKNKKTIEALEKSKEFRKKHIDLNKSEHNAYTNMLLKQIQTKFEKDISEILNNKQKDSYLEYRLRIY